MKLKKDKEKLIEIKMNFLNNNLEEYNSNLKSSCSCENDSDSSVCYCNDENFNILENFSKYKKKSLLKISSSIFILIIAISFNEIIHNSTSFPNYIKFLIYIPLYIFVAIDIIKSVFKNLSWSELLDENFLMLIATIGAIAIGEFPEAIAVIVFFNIGSYLEQVGMFKSKKSIKSLLSIKPDHANIIMKDQIFETKPENLKIGDKILIKPGEKVPIDCIILKGSSLFDTSPITGESIPKEFSENDEIYSGFINVSNTITAEVLKEYKNSSVMKILKLIEDAEERKSKIDKFIKRFAKIYTPVVVLIAIFIIFIPTLTLPEQNFTDWLYRGLIFLVISCPCSLVISVPLSYFIGIGLASRNGILIKGTNYIDVLAKLSAILYDKTGTITKGNFKVMEIVSLNGFSKNDLLYYASLAEAQSIHPIAQSISNFCKEELKNSPNQIAITQCENIPSYGISAIINHKQVYIGNDKILHKFNIPHEHKYCELKGTIAHISIEGRYAGYFLISDEIKSEAFEVLKELKNLGIKYQAIVSGDEESVVKYITTQLNVDEYFFKLLPDDKVKILMNTKKNHKYVGFVGDGINDAPVIASSDVGFVMGALGSDFAIESADVVITTDNLKKIPIAIKISKNTIRTIVQNIILIFIIKILFLILAAFGLTTMWLAIIADVGITLLVILNSIRKIKMKIKN